MIAIATHPNAPTVRCPDPFNRKRAGGCGFAPIFSREDQDIVIKLRLEGHKYRAIPGVFLERTGRSIGKTTVFQMLSGQYGAFYRNRDPITPAVRERARKVQDESNERRQPNPEDWDGEEFLRSPIAAQHLRPQRKGPTWHGRPEETRTLREICEGYIREWKRLRRTVRVGLLPTG